VLPALGRKNYAAPAPTPFCWFFYAYSNFLDFDAAPAPAREMKRLLVGHAPARQPWFWVTSKYHLNDAINDMVTSLRRVPTAAAPLNQLEIILGAANLL
jgi:hypothetical protein